MVMHCVYTATTEGSTPSPPIASLIKRLRYMAATANTLGHTRVETV